MVVTSYTHAIFLNPLILHVLYTRKTKGF